MRPSQYHYLKRMWTRNLYYRSKHKKKHKSVLLLCVKGLWKFYTFPIKMVIYPFKKIKIPDDFSLLKIDILPMDVLKSFGLLILVGIIVLGSDYLYNILGIFPIAILAIFVFFIIWAHSKRESVEELSQKAIRLEKIINSTTDSDEFEASIDEVKKISKKIAIKQCEVKLKDFELPEILHKVNYQEDIIRSQYMHREKASKMSDYDIERYAAMCNAYIEHQEEMEQYK